MVIGRRQVLSPQVGDVNRGGSSDPVRTSRKTVTGSDNRHPDFRGIEHYPTCDDRNNLDSITANSNTTTSPWTYELNLNLNMRQQKVQ
jgi:hypothetical protein